MARRWVLLLAVVSLVVVTAGPAQAQQAGAPAKQGDWEVIFTPYGWGAGVHGTTTMGDTTADVDVGFDDVLKDLELGFLGLVEVRYRRWLVALDTVYLALETDTTIGVSSHTVGPATVMAGPVQIAIPKFNLLVGPTDINVKVQTFIPSLFFGYRLVSRPVSGVFGQASPNDKRRLDIDLLAGPRLHYFKIKGHVNIAAIQRPGFPVNVTLPRDPPLNLGSFQVRGASFGKKKKFNVSKWWVDPMVGMRARAGITDRFKMTLAGNVGGFGVGSASEFSWSP